MDFSSIPLYLDPPLNWHQISNNGSPQQQQLLSLPNQQLPAAPPSSHVGSSIRRGSMADRARMANVPLPEMALKCPRCDSTNTKFCYFNNYSLSQPRHFCKACRRYWTRGGALRSVPVGGGFRRNKKNKTKRSKSPIARNVEVTTQLNNNNNNNSNSPSIISSNENIVGHLQPQHPHLSFMASLNNLSRYDATNLGLNFNEIQARGGARYIRNDALMNDHHWRDSQNFSLLGDLETTPTTVLRSLQITSERNGNNNDTNSIPTINSRATQLPQVTIEETQELNLLKSSNNLDINQFWSNGSNGWSDHLSAI